MMPLYFDYIYENRKVKTTTEISQKHQGFCNKYLIPYKFTIIVIERQIDHFSSILNTILFNSTTLLEKLDDKYAYHSEYTLVIK